MESFKKEIEEIVFSGILAQNKNCWDYAVDGSDGSKFAHALLGSKEIAQQKLDAEISKWISLTPEKREEILQENREFKKKLQKIM